MDAVAIIGAITGIASLILYLYKIGVKDGKVDTKLDVLWKIYVLDALHDAPTLAQHHSPPSITDEGVSEIPDDIKKCLDDYKKHSGDYGYDATQCLGLDQIRDFAQSKNWTVRRAVGLLSLYLKKAKEGK